MPFTATLTNPLPKGQIETTGTFGPWQKGDPGDDAARRDVQLSERGPRHHQGHRRHPRLDRRRSAASSSASRSRARRTPGFPLDDQRPAGGARHELRGGRRRHGRRHVSERGQRQVPARRRSPRRARSPAQRGSRAEHQAERPDPGGPDRGPAPARGQGRQAAAGGRGRPAHRFHLPPGERDVIEKLQLAGKFDVGAAKFTDDGVQQKLSGMSHRARGRDPDVKAENVVSDLGGSSRLKDWLLSFSDLAFAMPGALVRFRRVRPAQRSDCVRRHAAHGGDDLGGGRRRHQGVLPEGRSIRSSARRTPARWCRSRVGGTQGQAEFGLDVGKVFKKVSVSAGAMDGADRQSSSKS